MKLNKEEWNQLDDLIRKMGFGGYYDLIECLKMILNNQHFDIVKKNASLQEKITKETDLYTLINLILLFQKMGTESKK